MVSPVNNLKTSLFGHLKSYGDAVQGAFEQRIARPLIAFKRDLGRSSSKPRTSIDQESSSPIEIIDFETNGPIQTIIDKIKHTVSSSTERRTSVDSISNDRPKPTRDCRHSSISSPLNKTDRNSRLYHHKSVSFAEHIQHDKNMARLSQSATETDDEFVHNAHTLIDHSAGAADQMNTMATASIFENNETDFDRNFRQMIKPRRISMGNSKELVYQDLSAEIVAYVLKHALRVLEKEDEDLLLAGSQSIINQHEQDENMIDLK